MPKPLLFLIWLLPVLAVSGIVHRAPNWLEPWMLTVTLKPGRTLTLGRETLWAPQADGEHVLLQRTADGVWRLTNIAPGKQVLWRPAGGDERSIREWPLTTGATFAVGTQRMTVLAAEAGRLRLQTADQYWEYNGVTLRRNGQALPECYGNRRSELRNGLATLGLSRFIQRPLRLGGGVYCADRLGLADAPVDTAMIVWTESGFVLRPGHAGRLDGPPVTVAVGTPDAESLWRRSVSVTVNDQWLIGRTRYRVARMDADDLELEVSARAQRRWAGTTADAAAEVRTQWREPVWSAASFRLKGLAALLLMLWAASLVQRRLSDLLQLAVSLTAAGACLALYSDAQAAPSLWSYLWAWPALGAWLWTARSPWSAGLLAALALLLGVGLVTLLQLDIGAPESGQLRYGCGNAALAGAFGWLAWAAQCSWRLWRPRREMQVRLAQWSLQWLIIAALTLPALQAGFGDESGWGGLQPFELTKLALVTAAAYALALKAQSWRRDADAVRTPWLLVLGLVVLPATASGFALLFLHDFSPLVLLLIWVPALVLAYLRAHPRPVRRWGGVVLTVALTLIFTAGVARLHERPDDFPLDFQADRIRVWAAPDQHPHSGYQLRRALEAVRAGGWRGAVWKDATNGRAMAIPVVESDFAPAFFLNRYGGIAALALAGLQTMFVLLLIGIADRALHRDGRSDAPPSVADGFAYFALCGGAALLGAHFLVSWGTNLGFLPVMGQPMSLLSAAGSHLTLFVLPLAALAVAVEERSYGDPS